MGKLKIDVEFIYPIGSVYISVVNVNPSNYWGGEWEPFAKGKTLVGVDTFQTEFNEVEKTGGEKTHKLTQPELPNVKFYGFKFWNKPVTFDSGTDGNYSFVNYKHGYAVDQVNGFSIESGGKDTPHNNLQPYITVYMWKRIA